MVEICPVGCQDEACTYLIIAPSSRVDASVIGILMFMYACGARIDMRLPRLSSRAMNSEALYGKSAWAASRDPATARSAI